MEGAGQEIEGGQLYSGSSLFRSARFDYSSSDKLTGHGFQVQEEPNDDARTSKKAAGFADANAAAVTATAAADGTPEQASGGLRYVEYRIISGLHIQLIVIRQFRGQMAVRLIYLGLAFCSLCLSLPDPGFRCLILVYWRSTGPNR